MTASAARPVCSRDQPSIRHPATSDGSPFSLQFKPRDHRVDIAQRLVDRDVGMGIGGGDLVLVRSDTAKPVATSAIDAAAAKARLATVQRPRGEASTMSTFGIGQFADKLTGMTECRNSESVRTRHGATRRWHWVFLRRTRVSGRGRARSRRH